MIVGKQRWFHGVAFAGFVAFLIMMPVAASGGNGALVEEADRDLQSARAAMAEQRALIARERKQLNERLDTLQAEVSGLRGRERSLREAVAQGAETVSDRRRRLEGLEAGRRIVVELAMEFRRSVETRMSTPQRLHHLDLLTAIDDALADDTPDSAVLGVLAPTLQLARTLAIEDAQTRRFPGEAIDNTGRVRKGQFARVGPMAYFLDREDLGGIIVADANGLDPLLADVRQRGTDAMVWRWFNGEDEFVPVDVSDGALLRITAARLSIVERMQQGGAVMIPLLALGLIVVVIAVWRYGALAKMDIDIDPALTGILERISAHDGKGATDIAASTVSPWKALLLDAVGHRDADRVYLEEILQDHIVMLGSKVTQYIGTLSICAAAAPLLGLLGTVTGMIHTFQLITIFGTGDARALSGGISEALVTTQFGLIIAVPALLVHAYLNRKAKRIIAGMEQAAIRFVRHGGEGDSGL